ncbi:putative alanine racemase domain protein [Rosellinia necatrix]|uniref:D-serine dehydratase n=1 Tax=Rosellinia necatrix TaxID=77044 RepID=A0A1S7ULR8_ROSNE|nr:putative alanine racemase domain protein [Rosellinia necatrix]
MTTTALSKDALRARFVGKTLHQVPTPAIVLDLAKVEANCNRMLEAARRMNLSWRAHIKTHKTEELTRLQVGDHDDATPANIIVSTLMEAESVVPLLKEYQARGRQVNLLYSFPLYPSSIDRLAAVSAQLGRGGLTVMVDHAEQARLLPQLASKSGGHPPLVFLKVNVGSDRAGVRPGSPECAGLARALLLAETVGSCVFWGLYSHAGHAYAARRDWEAMAVLAAEFGALRDVALRAVRPDRPAHPLVLSVGATPTVTTLQHPDFAAGDGNVLDDDDDGDDDDDDEAEKPTTKKEGEEKEKKKEEEEKDGPGMIKALIARMRAEGLRLEVHAGVYPTLDVQQLAAHACDAATLNASAVAVTVLAEVASVYPGRGAGGKSSEAIVNAGCLALGREPCEALGAGHYAGWGILMPWAGVANVVPGPAFPAVHGGWQVARLSQEHGVLAWRGGGEQEQEKEKEGGGEVAETRLEPGQRVRIWPNHSCIAGAAHPWYLVVDSRNQGREDEIVDVWVRWNGW